MRAGGPNPFVDPEGCKGFLDRAEAAVKAQAARQAAE